MKTCAKCKKQKDLIYFGIYKRTSDGLNYSCKECNRESQRINYKKHKTKINKQTLGYKKNNPRSVRNATLKHFYGISINEYENLLQKQNGVCAICKELERVKDKKGNIRNLAVDHNHKTEKIRGLLCYSCNTGIGSLKENIHLLNEAIKYLSGSL